MCSAIYFVSRDSGDDIVQRNLFRDPGGDTVQRNLFANILNSPATPEVAVNQVALSDAQAAQSQVIDGSFSGESGVSSVGLKGDDTSLLHHARRPLDSSVVGSGTMRTSDSVTPYSGYQDLVRAAHAMKAARGRAVQGGAIPPTASDSHISETSTPNSDPLHAYAVVPGTGRGMAQSRCVFTRGRGGSVIGVCQCARIL